MFVVQDVLFQNILDLFWELNVMEHCKVLPRANTYRDLGIEIINVHVDTRNSRSFLEYSHLTKNTNKTLFIVLSRIFRV